MSDWIEIKEGCRMPQNGHDMLVVREDRGVEKGHYFACNSPIDGWYVQGNRVEGVTHYMPFTRTACNEKTQSWSQ